MKAIINGLMYDTEKAKIIFEPDKYHTMYMTEKGNLFMLYHQSGEKAISCTDNEKLKKILAGKATDKYIELFGEVEEA